MQKFTKIIEAKAEILLWSDSLIKKANNGENKCETSGMLRLCTGKFINAKMTKQIICVMVNNLINLDKSQSWTLDLEGIHFEAIASNSDEKKAMIPFVFKI